MGTNGTTTIELNGTTYEVHIPSDWAAQRELVNTMQGNTMRGSCALLGMMVPALGFTHLYGACQCNGLVFGGKVWKDLVAKGVAEVEIPEVGLDLYKLLKPIAYPSENEVMGELGNSSAPVADSDAKPSQSSEAGASTPAG